MRKFVRRLLIPIAGLILILVLGCVCACGKGKGGKLKLDAGGGGTLSKTEYSVKAGSDLASFLEDKLPAIDAALTEQGLTFAGWYRGDTPIEEGATMPKEGLTLTAKYYAPYTLTVQRGDDAPEATKGKAIWHAPFNVLDSYPLPEGFVQDDSKNSVTQTDSLEAGAAFTLYLRGREVVVDFRANAPAGVTAGGQMLSEALSYGDDFTIPACAYTLPEGYRFAGWTANAAGTGERYFAGDVLEDVAGNVSLFANWDRAYTDLAGGDDLIYLPSEKENVALLVREGLGEKEGVYNAATRIFDFTLTDGTHLTGRVTDWDRYTFTYEQDRTQVTYTYRDAYTGEGEQAITLTLDIYDGAVFSDPEGVLFENFSGTASGIYEISQNAEGRGLCLFVSDEVVFIFKTGEEDVFLVQGFEAGTHYLLTEGGLDDYYTLTLDGFGNALYEVYGGTSETGTYSPLGNGEYTVELGSGNFSCMLVILDSSTTAYLVSDEDLIATYESADGKAQVALDGYGDMGYATVTEEGVQTLYAKYWEVFTFTEEGTAHIYRYLRLFDPLDPDGEILRTLLFKDDAETFEEVGVEAGQYFSYHIIGSAAPISPYFLLLDGNKTGDAAGGWALYSFTAEGDETLAVRLVSGTYESDGSGDIALTRVGNADEAAPSPFKDLTVNVMLLAIADSSTQIGVFIAEEKVNEMTLYAAADGSRAQLRIDAYGFAHFTDEAGGIHTGTAAVEDFADAPLFAEADAAKDALLLFTDLTTEEREQTYLYLPDGLDRDNTFYVLGSEYGNYEGGTNELFNTYLFLSGLAGEGGNEGPALFGSTSGSMFNTDFVVEGVYYRVSEEYFGTVWQFEGKSFQDSSGIPDFSPTSINFCFVLDTIDVEGTAWPVFREYNKEDEAEYRGKNGEVLIVTGVRTAQFTDAEGRRWTGEAMRSEDLDFFGNHIADTVIFEYTGTDGGLYEFTFRVDDATGTFLIQGAEVGNYYQIDALTREVNSALRLALDGYGGATLFVPNAVTPDRPETGTILVTGSYEETAAGIYRFTPDAQHPNASDYPAFTFGCGTFTESVSHGLTEYAVYYVYEIEREGKFVNADWSVLTLNGCDKGVWIDRLGRRREGTFAVLGTSVVRFVSEGETFYFRADRTAWTFTEYEEDFVVENGVLLAYTGSDRNVVIGTEITKIGKGAFLDAHIASVNLGGVTEIGDRAFDGATLISVTGGDQVVRIGDQAFLYCDNLTEVNFPKATYVGRQAFALCYSLARVTLGEVTFLGDRAFESCLTDPADLTSTGTFELILANKSSAPALGGTGVFAVYYAGGTFKADIDFVVRVGGLDALKAFYLHKDWINGSKGFTGETFVPVGDTFNRNISFAAAGDEAGAWYATTTLERIFLNGLITVEGRHIGAYECKEGTLTIYSYADPSEEHEGNFTTSEAKLANGTLTGAFGGDERTFKKQGETLTYANTEEGAFSVVLGEQFPLLGTFKERKTLVRSEGGKAVFELDGYRYALTLGDNTYTLERTRARFDAFIEGENGSSLRITMDETGNVRMTNVTLYVDGKLFEIASTSDCGQIEKDGEPVLGEYYLDTAVGAVEGKILRIYIKVVTELDEEAMLYRYSFTYEAQDYLTLEEAPVTDNDECSVIFGYTAEEHTLEKIWMHFHVVNVAGLERDYYLSGTFEEDGDDYLFYAIDGYDPVEGTTSRIKPSKDAGGKITSVTVEVYVPDIDFEGTAEDGSTVHIVSQKDAGGNFDVTVEGEFTVEGKKFTATAARIAEFISGNTFAVYTDKSVDETQYYRILITIDPLGKSFTYRAERAGIAVKTVVNDTFAVWVYAPGNGFNSTTWFFVQIEETVGGVTTTLEGKAVYENVYPYNVTFTVPTEEYGDRIFRFRVGSALGVTDFKAFD